MPTQTSEFDYDLPSDHIAQHSVEPRDHSKLMVLDRKTGEIQHKLFYDVIDELHAGDVLVFNDTKVFKERLLVGAGFMPAHATGQTPPGVVKEIFLLRCIENVGAGFMPALSTGSAPPVRPITSTWQALVRPAKKLHVDDTITINNIEIIVRDKQDDGVVMLEFPMDEAGVLAFTDEFGLIPIPPYVSEMPTDANKYQTVYARDVGSVAAPTAGFHFTNDLIERLKQKGIEIAFVTLHVGIGTFRPMQSDTIEEHTMHSEFVQIPEVTASIVNRAKQEHRRVIAVGTTTVRSLEGAAASSSPLPRGRSGGGLLPEHGFQGDVNLFITPGFDFQIIDGMITNFHLPKSTLLVLVSAFAGRHHVLRAYREAIANDYRFFSFGDAMMIR